MSSVVKATLCVRIDDGPQVCIPIEAEYNRLFVHERYGDDESPIHIEVYEANGPDREKMIAFWEQFRVQPAFRTTDSLVSD